MNDIAFGATLVACLVATVVTVSMEATSAARRTDTGSAVVHRADPPKRVAANHDKGCVTTVAAEQASVE